MTPSTNQRAAIAEALHPVIGTKVEDGSAEVSSFSIPGLADDAVWKVTVTDLDHPQQAYVGLCPAGTARVLSDDQSAFFDLVQTLGGARLVDAPTALGYVIAFLEATRGPTVLVRPLDDVRDIPWRPGSTDEEARRAAFLAAQTDVAPTVTRVADGYRVQLWLVVDQRIQVNSFDVGAKGALSASFRMVAADLPLPVAR